MILKNKAIFILGFSRFDGIIESTSFTLAKFLARTNDVYYIDFPYTLKDFFSRKNESQRNQFQKREKAFFSAAHSLLNTYNDRLKVMILPPLVSKNFLPKGILHETLLGINEVMIARRIRSTIRQYGIKDYIYINSFNFHYPNIGRTLCPSLNVYHCVDPLVVDYDRKHGIDSEKKLVEQSDLVICTSKQLYFEKRAMNQDTFFIPNAADLEHCSKALKKETAIHEKLVLIKGPIIGYFGNVERRIDFGLLTKVVTLHPDKSFVFVGPVDDYYVPSNFRELSNVYFIGEVPYSDMPSVVKGFDVAMIPFKEDEVSATIFPLKLFEYLGAGRPVVATNFNPDLKDFTGDTVFYSQNSDEFSKALVASIEQGQQESYLRNRLSVASSNTWEQRLTEFSELLSSYYQKTLLEEN